MSETSVAWRIYVLCAQCAKMIYGSRPPTDAYGEQVARLLFGTAAQESGLRWERQRSPRWDGDVGGFSKWQLEKNSILDSLAYLRARPDVLRRATLFLFEDPNTPTTWVDTMPIESILWAMRLDNNDKIGVLFARLHYLRVAEPVPTGLYQQAAYWKRYYNTPSGAGTAEQYIQSWLKYAPTFSIA